MTYLGYTSQNTHPLLHSQSLDLSAGTHVPNHTGHYTTDSQTTTRSNVMLWISVLFSPCCYTGLCIWITPNEMVDLCLFTVYTSLNPILDLFLFQCSFLNKTLKSSSASSSLTLHILLACSLHLRHFAEDIIQIYRFTSRFMSLIQLSS